MNTLRSLFAPGCRVPQRRAPIAGPALNAIQHHSLVHTGAAGAHLSSPNTPTSLNTENSPNTEKEAYDKARVNTLSMNRGGTFAAVVPLPRRWARAKTWAQSSRAGRLDAPALSVMRELEWANRG